MANIFQSLFSSCRGNTVQEIAPSEVQSLISVQIMLLMEQYIKENSSKLVPYKAGEECAALSVELHRLTSLGLENTKNARIIKDKLDLYNRNYENQKKAEALIEFIKDLRKHFGDSTLLISSEQFEKLCKKYKLTTGLLSDYTGIIPDKNIKEIQNVRSKIRTFQGQLNYANEHKYLWKITECENRVNSDNNVFDDFVKWIESKNGLVFADREKYNWDEYLWMGNMKFENPDIPSNVRNYELDSLLKAKGYLITQDTMFIACPPEQLKEQSLKITKRAVDPIVFQYSQYGIVIHSIWGEEAEDKVFEEYKRINNLLSI